MASVIVLRNRDGSLRVFSRLAMDREAVVLDWDAEHGPAPAHVDELGENGPTIVPLQKFDELPDSLQPLIATVFESIEIPSNEDLDAAGSQLSWADIEHPTVFERYRRVAAFLEAIRHRLPTPPDLPREAERSLQSDERPA